MSTDRTSPDGPLLSLRQVSKSFGSFALQSVDLEVQAGQVVGLIGANGAGKTTAIKCALGAVRPDSGSTHLIDKRRVGVVLDSPPYLPTWTVADVERALAPFYPHWRRDTFTRLSEWAGLKPSAQVKDLSRGMSMRLQVAVALSHDAQLLILDEPTSGIDPVGRSELLDELSAFMLDEDHAVLFSTHITGDLERIADRLVVFSGGRVVVAGDTVDVLESFRMVRGGVGELPDRLRDLIHGLREHSVGWSGLMSTEDTVHLKGTVVAEQPSFDDLVVHLTADDTWVDD
ncbi:ABC-2 type transport system ATP-binding protein [Austwickia chelonae]|uniref:Putative ABC transporter ATP-binding protein n=1 Tax=Austwickia chelonae NBRC 105200 TaxID=1184607 RepID=K6VNG4_9MICO|nr:ABC transporter ATP-binding protein [Austwickia chelonae]GAB78274.1 putative ABC transporter ATP-binding protein [Austwickia chelonae NBRC 105200]SEW00217.1 ABC-2 type transport system ATP-binding protein [Austwickia chelonae]